MLKRHQYYTIHVGEFREEEDMDKRRKEGVVGGGSSRRWFNLTIENVRPSGSGGYTCVAQNGGGVAEGNVTVVYSETAEHYRDELVRQPVKVTVIYLEKGTSFLLKIFKYRPSRLQ